MIVSYNSKELDLLARIMRAEALNEGELGMLMVGNVVVNRVLANCLTFKNINSVYNAIYQKINLWELQVLYSKRLRLQWKKI